MSKKVQNSETLSIRYSKPLREYRNLKFKTGDRVCISKYDWPFRNSFGPVITQIFFRKCCVHNKRWSRFDYPWQNLSKTVEPTRLSRKKLTRKLFSNSSTRLFPDKTLRYFTNFSPEQQNLEGQKDAATSKKSYQSMYQNAWEVKIMFFEEKHSKSPEFYYLGPWLYASITNSVEAKNTLNQERQIRSESCITVEVSQRTQEVRIYTAKEKTGPAFFDTDLENFRSNVRIDSGRMLREQRNHNLHKTPYTPWI